LILHYQSVDQIQGRIYTMDNIANKTADTAPVISLDQFTSFLDYREVNSAHKIYNMIDWANVEAAAAEFGFDSPQCVGAIRTELTLARSKNDFQSMVNENFDAPMSNGDRFKNWLSYALSRGK
jgi:hypothetical protein